MDSLLRAVLEWVALVGQTGVQLFLGVAAVLVAWPLMMLLYPAVTVVTTWSELRRTVLSLAEALAEERLRADADERVQARQSSAELVRAASLARGEVPEQP